MSSYSANRSFLLVSGALSDKKKNCRFLEKTSALNNGVETHQEKMSISQTKKSESGVNSVLLHNFVNSGTSSVVLMLERV